MYRIGINGYGRIGRSILRALTERQAQGQCADMQIVSINEPSDAETILHLTQYDSTHGRFQGNCRLDEGKLFVNERPISLSHQDDINHLRWPDVDLVMECSGQFSSRQYAERHIYQGADKVLFSHPADKNVDRTVIYGINHQQIETTDRILSNGSCTTNACVPLLKLIDETHGIDAASITTIHSVMNDQPLIDAFHHTDLRKTRSATQSIIPVDTALAKGIYRFLPHLAGRISAQALRVPTMNVSAINLCIQLNNAIDADTINQQIHTYTEFNASILTCNSQPLASIDFNHDSHSAIIDLTQTSISGDKLLKLFIWFDNEWGFANRMIDVAQHIKRLNSKQPGSN